ncbi:MAG: acyltransferase family protein [Nostocoides sp.]
MTTRDRSIDVAKGIAIIMIVLGHVLRGLVAAGVMDSQSSAYRITDRAVYLVHLTMFALLSGLFVRRGVERHGAGGYIVRRDVLLLWLLLVWSIIQGSVKVAAGGLINAPIRPIDLLMFWRPDGQLWFLWWLILVTTITALVRPWSSPLRAVALLASTSILTLATWGVGFGAVPLIGIQIAPFFVLGTILGAAGYAAAWSDRRRTGTIAGAGVAAWLAISCFIDATPPTGEGFASDLGTIAWGVAGTLLGTTGLLALATLLTSGTSWLALCGRRSLEIFLAHIIVASGARIGLVRLGVDGALINVLVGTVLGVSVPVMLAALAGKLRLSWLFALPNGLLSKLPGR